MLAALEDLEVWLAAHPRAVLIDDPFWRRLFGAAEGSILLWTRRDGVEVVHTRRNPLAVRQDP